MHLSLLSLSKKKFKLDQIDDIDCKSYPPTIKVDDELIFLKREKKDEL